MKDIIFESSPFFIILCFAAGAGYAFLLYKAKHPWSKTVNWLLFALRAVVVFFLALLLLGPIVKQINNQYIKPVFVILQDDSESILEQTDSLGRKGMEQALAETQTILTEKGYEIKRNNLQGDEVNTVRYTATSSDLAAALKKISNRYEGRNVSGVLLVSDGIYNSGVSPLYASYNFPIYAVGIGDTAQRIDLSIKNIAYNKIVYQGNKFPVRVEVLVNGLPNQTINVSLQQRGVVLEKQSKYSGTDHLLTFDFQALAKEQGIQKLDVQVEVRSEERNIRNNRLSAFVEVVEGKKKILVIAGAPHPDIKALREVIDKNSNYELLLHIPGLSEQPADVLKPGQADLAVFCQSPDVRGKTRDLFQQFMNSKTSMFVMMGQQSDLQLLSRTNLPVHFITPPREYDEVTPVVSAAFSNFELAPENKGIMADYPPVSVPFGKMQIQPTATSLLFQRIGTMATEKPLLSIMPDDGRKMALLLGDGIWRWRLNEFDRTSNTIAFDELFGKLIQYLSTADDRRKFRSYPVQQEFSDAEPVVFESQIYNDLFEPVYGNTIQLDITNEHGQKTSYSYVMSPGNTRYSIGGLKEGVYRYKSKTTINGKSEEIQGAFAVIQKQMELQNLTADFDLLRRLSNETGGEFYNVAQFSKLQNRLKNIEAKSIIHSEEHFNSLINLKWIFVVLLTLLAAEWTIRKYNGSY